MRTRDEMLKDTGSARLRYAMLSNPSDMLVIRLAMDVTDLLATLAEKDAEIERLTNAVEFHRVASNMRNDDIKKLRMEIGCYEDERSDR